MRPVEDPCSFLSSVCCQDLLSKSNSRFTTWFVFTDGACEPEERAGSIGGVLYNPAGDCLHFFGESVPPDILEDLFSRSQNPIHELELLPILVAALLWGEFFSSLKWSIMWTMSQSARMACIRGSGETLRAGEIVQSFVEVEARLPHRVWFGRVPSFSNPSDAPSRLDFQEVLGLGAVRTSVDWEMTRRHLSL